MTSCNYARGYDALESKSLTKTRQSLFVDGGVCVRHGVRMSACVSGLWEASEVAAVDSRRSPPVTDGSEPPAWSIGLREGWAEASGVPSL
jgi:hypothetical protein